MLSEADYNDTEAVNAQQLLQNAKAYFQDIQNPEIEYDISVLDIAALSQADSQHLFMGNPQYNTIQMAAPRITDQILLNIDAINSQPNILYDLTSKKLYIVGLSYDLRSDEIKYTVNYANYKDRFMKNLVKLISV